MTRLRKYQEQFERVMRWYEVFDEIKQSHYRVYPKDVNPDEIFLRYSDDVLAFFLNCYHLKDWIKQDDTIEKPSINEEVETFINDNECLRICADICNSAKHLKLNKRRNQEIVDIKGSLWTGRNRWKGGPIEPEFFVVTESGEKDAAEVALECVQKWKEFIRENIENENT